MDTIEDINTSYNEKYGFFDEDTTLFKTKKGIDLSVIEEISKNKLEPKWMLNFRKEAFKNFLNLETPKWGPSLKDLDLENIHYYIKPKSSNQRSWSDVPENIKNTFERLGIPQAEREALAGIGAQYDSEMVYHNVRQDLEKQGVIFTTPEEAVLKYPELVKMYMATVVPINDNKFAALNSAVWSGGSFVYIPKGVKVSLPLQSYFRINSKDMGQFERTLIIADEDSFVHYIEGCTAPTFSSSSLHAAVVEIIAKKGARVRYSTVQNWSSNVYNLVTKRAHAYENATVEWVDGNIGAKLTMKYPSVVLLGEGAHGEVLSIAFAKQNQIQDTGTKMIHLASNTSSLITSKSISKENGIATYRGQIYVEAGLKNIKTKVECDALLLDEESKTNTYPYMDIKSRDVEIEHEATVSKLSEEKLIYLMSRGFEEDEAALMIVNGFIDPLVKQLPMEFAVELNKLIELEMEGSVG